MSLEKALSGRRTEALKWCARLLFAASFALLSFYHIIHYEKWVIICTVATSGLIGLVLIRKAGVEFISYIQAHKLLSALYLCIALILVTALHMEKDYLYTDVVLHPLPFLAVRFFRFRWMILAVPALFFLVAWVGKAASRFISDFWGGLSASDRKLYLALTLAASIVILAAYIMEPPWYRQYDRVYSIDSGYYLQKMYPLASYYAIHHPTLSILTFPLWAVIHTVLGWFVPAQLLDVLCISCSQIIHAQALLVIGFLLERLTGSRWTRMLYFASFPTLLFTMFPEKYQFAIFFLVLYAYYSCREDGMARGSFILAAGAMSTSAFLYANELLSGKPAASKVKSFFKTFLAGVAFLICSGRIHLLYPPTLWNEVSHMARSGRVSNPIVNCFFSLTHMVHGSFLSSSSVITLNQTRDLSYLWTDNLGSPPAIGLAIIAVIVLGIFVNYKDPFIKLCSVWAGFSIVLFLIFQWSVHESPLFSIYFSWALVPLFQKGFQALVERFHWKERAAYGALLILILAINLATLVDIGMFLESNLGPDYIKLF